MIEPAIAWHEAECGRYTADLPLWLELAGQEDGPVLDVGAGTGRVARALAAAGHEVVALDIDPVLLGALHALPAGAAVETVCADARDFALGRDFGLILAPMQTVQLLRPGGRAGFLRSARAHLAPGGLLACALADARESQASAEHVLPPLPDVLEEGGHRFVSQPVAVRVGGGTVAIDRIRTHVAPGAEPVNEGNTVELDLLSAVALAEEAETHGLEAVEHRRIPATDEHVGSEVVLLRG